MKILIGYDGTPTAEAVLGDLRKAGLPAKAQVCVLVAMPLVLPAEALSADPTGVAWLPTYAEIGAEKERVDAALRLGSRAAESLRAGFPGWEIQVEARFETPAQAILEFADKWKPDLIAVGSHGWTWLGRTFLGSTAEKVLSHAKTNVRLCHPRTGDGSVPPRVLVAVDGSGDSRQAVTEIGNRNWPAGTRIKLVAAREFLPWAEAMITMESAGMPVATEDPGPWTWMEGYLKRTVADMQAQGLEVESAILDGDPRHVLLTEAESFQADGIFMGRRGVTGFQRLLLGSVSGAVASHAPCSVEIIRT